MRTFAWASSTNALPQPWYNPFLKLSKAWRSDFFTTKFQFTILAQTLDGFLSSLPYPYKVFTPTYHYPSPHILGITKQILQHGWNYLFMQQHIIPISSNQVMHIQNVYHALLLHTIGSIGPIYLIGIVLDPMVYWYHITLYILDYLYNTSGKINSINLKENGKII